MTKTIYGMGREIESKGLLFLCHPLCKRPMNTSRNLDVGLLHFVEAEQTTLPAVACVCSAGSNGEHDLCRSVDARPIGIDAIECPARRQAFELSRSEEHTSELQSLMRISYAVFCLKKK